MSKTMKIAAHLEIASVLSGQEKNIRPMVEHLHKLDGVVLTAYQTLASFTPETLQRFGLLQLLNDLEAMTE